MGAAPALEFRVDRLGVWRAGVGLLVALSCLTMLIWWTADPPLGKAASSAWAGAGCALAVAVGAGLLRGPRTLLLRWDRQRWWIADGGQTPRAGNIGVALDFGAWMLLRFVPDGRLATLRACWIPVQRRGAESAWHALRCAVLAQRARGSVRA